MKRSYLSPSLFFAVPMGIVCFIFFCVAFSVQNLTAAGLLIACGLLILGTGLYYICPIVSFDEKQIYILRLFFGTTRCIRWEDIRSISPLENGGAAGLACIIRTDKKEYTLTIFLNGWHKLLRHWYSIRPTEAVTPLKREQLPTGIYRKPFWKTFGFFFALFMVFLWLSSYPTFNDGRHSPAGFIWMFVVVALVFLLIGGCCFNYYEFTPTHFCIHSPIPFWNYKVRWEDIHSIRQYSTKANFVCILTKQYRYKNIMMGYLLPKEMLSLLQAAGVSIE